jgi:predicted alpha/beta hydrolase
MPTAREPIELRMTDGWVLRGEWLLPERPVAVAVVGHAMMVDRRTLDRPRGRGLVSHLADRGIAVLWPDLRGHGKSGPRPEDGGDWHYDDLVADVPLLLDAARARLPGLPLYVVGHSLFGHVTLGHLAEQPDTALDGLVLLACNVVNPSWRKRPVERWKKGALIALMHALTRARGRLPIRLLGIGSDDEPRGYVDDLVRTFREGRWLSRTGFDRYAALPRVRTPVLALVGAADRLLSPPGDARDLVAALPVHTFEVVGHSSGLPFDPGHMDLVLDARCAPVWDRVADFVSAARRR